MTAEVAEQKNEFSLAFRQVTEQRASEPTWLRSLRADSFALFEQKGFPAVTDEEWKYTNVAPIASAKFSPVLQANGTALTSGALRDKACAEARTSNLVFLNGIFRPDLSAIEGLPASVQLLTLTEALANSETEPVVRARLQLEGKNTFLALNTALFGDGLFLRIPQGVTVSAPIQLLFLSESSKSAGAKVASFPRVIIEAGRNST